MGPRAGLDGCGKHLPSTKVNAWNFTSMPFYMILRHGALSKENVIFLPRITTSMEKNPSSTTSSRSANERFNRVHNGQAVVPIVSQMRSVNIATSYNTHV